MSKSETKIRRTSDLWNYFTFINDKYATCNVCEKQMSHSSSSSNLRKHFKRKHGDYLDMNNTKYDDTLETENVEYVNLPYEIEESVVTEEEPETVTSTPVRKPEKPYINTISSTKHPVSVTQKLQNKPQKNNEMIQEAISILSNITQTNSISDTEDDEFGQFGKYVTAQLRQLPLLNALELQEKFYSMLTRERINVMKNATETHSYGLKSQSHYNSEQNKQQQENQQQKQQQSNVQQLSDQNPISLQIESSCSLIQSETEIYSSSASAIEPEFISRNLAT